MNEKTTLNLFARVSLNRMQGGVQVNPDAPDPFEMTVTDEESGVPIIRVTITPDQLADLLSSRMPNSSFGVELTQSPLHGLTKQIKVVDVPMFAGYSDAAAALACEEAERQNPGWEAGSTARSWNSNKYSNKHYAVTLIRWVRETRKETNED